jgi:hypothetical protein
LIRINNIQAMIASFPVIGTAVIPAVGPLAAPLDGRR